MRLKKIDHDGQTGLLVPMPLVERAGLGSEVTVEAAPGRLVLSPATAGREGWELAFAQAKAPAEEPAAPGEAIENDFDRSEWTWPA